MKNLIVLAALTGGMIAVTGCQVSNDHAHVDTTHRPADYTYEYRAIQDTPWKASTASYANSGTIARGTRVYFDRSPDRTMSWQQARLDDGNIRYVHPTDFEAAH